LPGSAFSFAVSSPTDLMGLFLSTSSTNGEVPRRVIASKLSTGS
jgi:hypothetical protein